MRPDETVQTNRRLITEMLDQVWNGGAPERLPEFWADDTRAEAEGLHKVLTTAFPDLRISIDDMIAEGDRVVVRLRFSGTHEGPFQGLPATGRRVEFGAIRIYRLADGRVVDTWAHQDSMGLMRQLRD